MCMHVVVYGSHDSGTFAVRGLKQRDLMRRNIGMSELKPERANAT